MSEQHVASTMIGTRTDRRAILDALDLLSNAAIWLSERTTAQPWPAPATAPAATRTAPALSPREREVVALMGCGCSNRQIAETLCISIATAERHASNIYNKLGFHSRSQVAAWAVFEGLVPGRVD